MPGRFTNLEFDDNARQELDVTPEVRGGLTRDEHHYLASADEEYRWGRFEKALQMYTRCLERDRSAVRAWVGQVQMLVQLGEYSEARLWSDKALELFRDNGELLAAKAQACVRLADTQAGMACSDSSLRSPGSSAWRWIVRGEVLLAKRQKYFDRCFDKALAEPDVDWFDRVVIGRIYLFYRRATNALQHFQEVILLQPTQGYLWYEIGNCQAALGLIAVARTSYERCLETRANYAEARLAIDALPQVSMFRSLLALFQKRT